MYPVISWYILMNACIFYSLYNNIKCRHEQFKCVSCRVLFISYILTELRENVCDLTIQCMKEMF